jgi:hypothetical protein
MTAQRVPTPANGRRARASAVLSATALRRVGRAAVHRYASRRPWSYRAEYDRLVAAELRDQPVPTERVTEADLACLPPLVAAHIRRSGAVGEPRVTNVRARFHGRIRAGAARPWMRFTGEQVNSFAPHNSRLFIMQATMFGLPVEVLHVFRDEVATMRVRVCSILPVVNAAGPDLDRGETVTLFNDLCLLAPAALIDAPVSWQDIDGSRIRGSFTHGAHTVTADMVFNETGELVDFISEDRSRASADGKRFVRQRWSTPVQEYQTIGSRRIPRVAEGRWHAPEPEGTFAYVELRIDQVEHNATATPAAPIGTAAAQPVT